jgi:D-lyxose ketol-isomerase
MKRSQINEIYLEATASFERHGWTLPPNPRWDITDFGLGDFAHFGLVLINLAEEPEYCEKLMYARDGQTTPLHTHAKKKEDIICRHGTLVLELWGGHPEKTTAGEPFAIRVNGCELQHRSGETSALHSGERITLCPGVYHAFWASGPDCIIGEVSTANDDAHDNFFVSPDIGRFPHVEEDAVALIKLLSDPQ